MKRFLFTMLLLITTATAFSQSVYTIEGDIIRIRKRVSGNTSVEVTGSLQTTLPIKPGSDTTSSKEGLVIVGGKLKLGNGTFYADVSDSLLFTTLLQAKTDTSKTKSDSATLKGLVDLRELLSNKVNSITSPNSTDYPTTQALSNFVYSLTNGKLSVYDTAAMLAPYKSAINAKPTYGDYRRDISDSLKRKVDTSKQRLDSFTLANAISTKKDSLWIDSLYQPLDKSLYAMTNAYIVYFKIQNNIVSQLKWLTWGDSYAQTIWKQMGDYVRAQVGGNLTGTFNSAQYNGTTNNATSGTVTENTGDYQTWVTGLSTTFGASGSRTYGAGGGSFLSSKITVAYPFEAGGCTFKIQVNGVDAVGFTNVSTTGTLGTLGIATIRQVPIASTVTIVRLTGLPKIVVVGFEDTTVSGLTTINISQGGIPLGGGLNSVTGYASALSNFNTFLAYIQPTVFTHEMKEDSSFYATALSTFYNGIKSNLTNTDVVMIATPAVSNNNANQIKQNAQLRHYADSVGFNFYDTYRLFGNYAKLVQLGVQGDGVHVSDIANRFRGMHMFNDIGLTVIDYKNNFSGNILSSKIETDTFRVKKIGNNYSDVFRMIPSAVDIDNYIRRNYTFYDTLGIVHFRLIGYGGTSPVIPNNIQVGVNNVRLQANTSLLTVVQPASNTPSHIKASTYLTDQATNSASSGNVTLDFNNAGFRTLTLNGNIGTISFSTYGGSEEFIVKIVQDATGGRTVTSWNSSIKFVGGVAPILSTSPNAIDVFTFRSDGSGGNFEVGRYIQDRNISTVRFGTNTNDAAAIGNVGENVESEINTLTNYTTSATYQNVASVTLTAGDWDISAIGTFNANAATITAAANAVFVVSTTNASASGATAKNTMFIPQSALVGTSAQSTASANYRVSISSTTTYFLNTQSTFTLGNPQFTGFIRARRMR